MRGDFPIGMFVGAIAMGKWYGRDISIDCTIPCRPRTPLNNSLNLQSAVSTSTHFLDRSTANVNGHKFQVEIALVSTPLSDRTVSVLDECAGLAKNGAKAALGNTTIQAALGAQCWIPRILAPAPPRILAPAPPRKACSLQESSYPDQTNNDYL